MTGKELETLVCSEILKAIQDPLKDIGIETEVDSHLAKPFIKFTDIESAEDPNSLTAFPLYQTPLFNVSYHPFRDDISLLEIKTINQNLNYPKSHEILDILEDNLLMLGWRRFPSTPPNESHYGVIYDESNQTWIPLNLKSNQGSWGEALEGFVAAHQGEAHTSDEWKTLLGRLGIEECWRELWSLCIRDSQKYLLDDPFDTLEKTPYLVLTLNSLPRKVSRKSSNLLKRSENEFQIPYYLKPSPHYSNALVVVGNGNLGQALDWVWDDKHLDPLLDRGINEMLSQDGEVLWAYPQGLREVLEDYDLQAFSNWAQEQGETCDETYLDNLSDNDKAIYAHLVTQLLKSGELRELYRAYYPNSQNLLPLTAYTLEYSHIPLKVEDMEDIQKTLQEVSDEVTRKLILEQESKTSSKPTNQFPDKVRKELEMVFEQNPLDYRARSTNQILSWTIYLRDANNAYMGQLRLCSNPLNEEVWLTNCDTYLKQEFEDQEDQLIGIGWRHDPDPPYEAWEGTGDHGWILTKNFNK